MTPGGMPLRRCSALVVTANVPSGSALELPGCSLRYPARSMRKSFSVRSAIETPLRQVFQVDDGVLQLQKLLAAVLQVVHLVAGLVLDDVLLAGGRDVEQHHAAADALLEVDVLLQLHVRPEVDELDAARSASRSGRSGRTAG